MGINLKNELEQEKRILLKKSSDENQAIAEVKLLLQGDDQEDARILRYMGRMTTSIQLESLTGSDIQLEKLEKEYGQVYTIDQIKKLAIDYRLRFLNSNHFTGNMDVEVTSKIKEFAKQTGTGLDEYTLRSRFFILSVPGSFALEQVQVKRFAEWKERRRLAMLDPVLFYKIDETHYRLIHQWGKEFTAWRRILGWRWKNQHTFRASNFLLSLPIVSLIFSSIWQISFFYAPIMTSLLIIGISGAMAWIANLYVVKDTNGLFEVEYAEEFFTPNNWNSTRKLIN